MSSRPEPADGADAAGPVASPCIAVCEPDAAGVLCVGCGRTLQEIAAWRDMGEDARRRAAAAARGRLAARRASP